MPSSPARNPVVTVSALNRMAREALEGTLPLQWIAGEVSSLTRAASGHVYFTLKDDRAQVRCTLWRSRAQSLPMRLQHGQQVEVRALATLYEARGDFQLNVESVRQAGVGSLYEAFLRLREELGREGLFDPDAKRPIPRYPAGIGVITSPQAAALKDVLATLARRAPGLQVRIYPASVQGDKAAAELTAAVSAATRRADQDNVEILLLVRGGGSMEDLWAFNDAALARAIRAAPVPVISGVGHETDFCIADFVADLRAATPTAAAEIASAGFDALRPELDGFARSMTLAMRRQLERAAQRLDIAQSRLVHPRERVRRDRERVDSLRQRLLSATAQRVRSEASRVEALSLRVAAREPATGAARERLGQLRCRLDAATSAGLRGADSRVRALAAALEHLAPRAVLARGYSITRDADGRIVADASNVAVGESIAVELASGSLRGRVTERST